MKKKITQLNKEIDLSINYKKINENQKKINE